jgi:hypothetical protein
MMQGKFPALSLLKDKTPEACPGCSGVRTRLPDNFKKQRGLPALLGDQSKTDAIWSTLTPSLISRRRA